jgi:tRNA G18 (ribose-2'-O)-methylase SpoU
MPPPLVIDSLDDPRVADYQHLADHQHMLDRGLFIAEGRLVVRRLLELRQWAVESILLTPAALENLRDVIHLAIAPVYLVDQALMNAIAGFNIHRGCLALAHRRKVEDTASLGLPIGPLSRVLLLEGVNNPDNVGGLFRTAAAFGVELVVLGPSCGDPLYRKAIRTSMAATLVVPYITAPEWPAAITDLRTDGFTVAALTPRHDAMPLRELPGDAKLALIVGAEGDGLTGAAMAAATVRVCIPMTQAVDSLNVTTAASIAMYHCWQESRGIR